MKVTESKVAKLEIIGADGLDPITVVFEDFGPAQGKFIIECWGDCWSHYWGAMWEGFNVRQFFMRCDDDYIARKCVKDRQVIDYDAISEKIGEVVTNELEVVENEELMCEHYGSDWRMDLPEKDSREYTYFRKIIAAVKGAISSMETIPA